MTKRTCFKIFCSKCDRDYKPYFMGQKEVFSDDKEAKECIEDEGNTWTWVDSDTQYCPKCWRIMDIISTYSTKAEK